MKFVLLIFLPIIVAIFVPFFYRKISRIHTGWFVFLVPAVLFVYYTTFLDETLAGEVATSTLPWIPALGISFVAYIDGLSLLFSLLITGIGMLVVLYSIYYLDQKRENLGNFYVFLLMFMTAMLGVVQSDNLLTLYLFWELTSISSFLLIGFWFTRDRSRFGALKSMLLTVFGGLMMLGGFILLGIIGESFSIRELISNLPNYVHHDFFVLAFIFILLGAFTKSAQFPFYIWLPDAMEAPTPVSAYLHSATMVKAGLYLVARLTPIFAVSEVWIWLVSGIGIITLCWGSFFAVKQTDLKAILAFSTVSQLGLIMSLLGISGLSYHVPSDMALYSVIGFAAIFHLLNHAVFKGSLFMVAGIVDHETGTRDIRKLGGLMSVMPLSFTIALIGSMSMAGLPPFGGFLSKELFFTSMLRVQDFSLFAFETWGVLFPILAWFASVFTFIYSFYFVFHTFAGKEQFTLLPRKPHEAPFGMLLAPSILAVFVIVIFFMPNVIGNWFVKPAVTAMHAGLYTTPLDVPVDVVAWHGFTPELFMTIGVVGVGALLYATLAKWQNLYALQPEKLSFNALYDMVMLFTEKTMNKLSRLYMTGILRTYLIYMFVAIVVLTLATLFIKDAFHIDRVSFSPINWYGALTAIVLIIAVIITVLAKRRLIALIAVGAVGYAVALLFVIFKAPDLALTQLVIETISVALFLLAFYHLPNIQIHGENTRFRFGNFLVALGVGLTMSLLVLAAHSQKLVPSIAQYYKNTVLSEAGGKNIVNVILVDYRGFDTLFEIAVLAIAGIGVFSLIRLKSARKENRGEN